MSGEDFVRLLGEQARIAADGESLERSMSLARMMNVHYRPWHACAGHVQEDDNMTVRGMERRLDRLGGADGRDIAGSLQEASQRQDEREQAWKAGGREGLPSLGPMLPIDPKATRSQREMWRQIANGRARVIHIGTPETSPFKSLQEAYAMSDADLVRTINQHPSAAVWT